MPTRIREAPNPHWPLQDFLWAEAGRGRKAKIGCPMLYPGPGAAEGTSLPLRIASSDRPGTAHRTLTNRARGIPAKNCTAPGSRIGGCTRATRPAESDLAAGKDVFVPRVFELGFRFLQKRENMPLECYLTRAPSAVARVWGRGSRCAPGRAASRPELPAAFRCWAEPASDPSSGVESGSHPHAHLGGGPKRSAAEEGSWQRSPGMGARQSPGRVQDLSWRLNKTMCKV